MIAHRRPCATDGRKARRFGRFSSLLDGSREPRQLQSPKQQQWRGEFQYMENRFRGSTGAAIVGGVARKSGTRSLPSRNRQSERKFASRGGTRPAVPFGSFRNRGFALDGRNPDRGSGDYWTPNSTVGATACSVRCSWDAVDTPRPHDNIERPQKVRKFNRFDDFTHCRQVTLATRWECGIEVFSTGWGVRMSISSEQQHLFRAPIEFRKSTSGVAGNRPRAAARCTFGRNNCANPSRYRHLYPHGRVVNPDSIHRWHTSCSVVLARVLTDAEPSSAKPGNREAG